MEQSIGRILNHRVSQLKQSNTFEFKLMRSPLHVLNKKMAGFKKGELVIVGGRPSMGKTTFVNQLALEFAQHSKVMLNALGMDQNLLSDKLISQLSGIALSDIQSGEHLNIDYDMNRVSKKAEELNLDIFNGVDQIDEIEDLVRKGHYSVVVIDWFQRITDNDKGEWPNRANIANRLKKLALETDACIILVGTVSYEVELRGGECRPMLHDLRVCQEAEDYFDKVFMLYRPEYYHITEDENGNSNINKAILYLVKNVTGPLLEFELWVSEGFTKFYDEFITPDSNEIWVDRN